MHAADWSLTMLSPEPAKRQTFFSGDASFWGPILRGATTTMIAQSRSWACARAH
jgi:hypothetical protein